MSGWYWLGGAILSLGIAGGVTYWMVDSDMHDLQGAEPVEKLDGSKLSFSKDIQPILQEKCANCHNSRKKKAGLDVDTSYATTMKGIKTAKPDDSRIYKSLVGKGAKQMPPKNKLPEKDIEKIRAWIEAGAKNN